ncbi:hypothetical protein HYC85_008480 [Camellia sinensis]|uniref:ABC transporter domain-containing protein n=1 Tax=Camellia sinensis TaxID=4442 RepID=A0A7J7HU79_CAMSI|nr:hypothetical protein HYC85_008480 [Camellia sinensis]
MVIDAGKQGDEVARALVAADALGKASLSTTSVPFQDIADSLQELDMEHYDEEDDGVELIGTGIGDAYYPSNDMDPDVSYQPPGTQINLLNEVNICLPEKSFGLIFGRSGSGKTTLLQLIAGLTKPTSGSIYIQRYDNDGKPNQSLEQLTPERVGIVFQFPERYCFKLEN